VDRNVDVNERRPRPRLRRARVRLGWSQERAADEISRCFPHLAIDARQIGRWETGETRRPRPMNVWALCRTYGLPAEELDLPPILGADVLSDDPDERLAARAILEAEASDTKRRDVLRHGVGAAATLLGGNLLSVDWERLGAVADGVKVADEQYVADVEFVVGLYWQRYHAVAPRVLLPAVIGHVGELLRTVTRSHTSGYGRRLRSVAADAASLAGWLSLRVEDRTATAAFWALAEALATEAENDSLRRFALASRSSLYSRTLRGGLDGDTPLAQALLTSGLTGSDAAISPVQRAWMHARRGEEHASLGDAAAANRDLEASGQCLARVRERPEGFFAAWDEGQLAGYRGSCALALGSRDAIAVLAASLAGTDPSLISQRSAILTNLGAAHARLGQVDQACVAMADALTIAHRTGLALATRRVIGARRHLEGWSNAPCVRRLDELIASQG
jgi:transcriptional regulator with XRE-family HTH domain